MKVLSVREAELSVGSLSASGNVLLVGTVSGSCSDVGALASCVCPVADRMLLMVSSGRET